jgi:hypothetical protein
MYTADVYDAFTSLKLSCYSSAYAEEAMSSGSMTGTGTVALISSSYGIGFVGADVNGSSDARHWYCITNYSRAYYMSEDFGKYAYTALAQCPLHSYHGPMGVELIS